MCYAPDRPIVADIRREQGSLVVYKDACGESLTLSFLILWNDLALLSVSVRKVRQKTMAPEAHVLLSGPETGQPVLLLHGWGSRAAWMGPFLEGLPPECRVHALDLPGHGLTPAPPEPWGVPEYAAWVAEYVRTRIDGAPIPAIGHSNGGRILLYMAAHPAYTDLFSRFVLVSPSGVRPKPSVEVQLKRTISKAVRFPLRFLPEGPAKAFVDDWLRHSLLWKWLGSSDYNQLSGVMRATFVRTVTHTLDDVVSRIAQPTLLFWGDRDTAVSRYQMDVLAGSMQDAGLFVLPGAGHYGYLDAPDVVVGGTRAFLGFDSAPEPSQTELSSEAV